MVKNIGTKESYIGSEPLIYVLFKGKLLRFYFLSWSHRFIYLFVGVYTDQLNEDHALNKNKLISAYKDYFNSRLEPMIHEITDYDKSHARLEEKGFGEWPTSWSQQFLVLLKRDVKERKYESFSGQRICRVLMVALITGLLWYKSDVSHLQDQV